ncbi:MAG: MOSC N-terminal beta barrel domain-containing protein [Saprospiraceae bacterium]
MHIKSLHIYPIKGMSGTLMESVIPQERGFENDRRYMLIDKDNKFISQRNHPKIATLQPTISEEILTISQDSELLKIPLSQYTEEVVVTTIFGKNVPATKVSNEVDTLFSTVLGEKVSLVKMNISNVRQKELINNNGITQLSFADGYPYLIVGTASLELLNSKLEEQISMNRFRPNIVIETEIPHIEDTWNTITIGKSKFKIIKPCARCPVVTVDQFLGIMKKEPLKTLATYRKINNKVYFGANAISVIRNPIRDGDKVKVD